MSFLLQRNVAPLFICMLVIIITGQATADGLAEDFDALASYQFGMSRAPLQRISEAALAAAAGHSDVSYSIEDIEQRLSAMMSTDISLDAKRFICRLLGEIGGARAIEVLAQSLRDDALFNTALLALEQNPDGAAAAVLAGAQESAATAQRLAILAAMGRQGHPDSVAPLTRALDDATPGVMVAAAHALADLRHPDACQAVINKTATATPETGLLLADACLNCAETLRETDIDAVTTMLERLSQPEFPTHIRIAAIDGLMVCRPEQTQELLLAALQDEDSVLAHEALMLARANPAAEVVATLTTLLQQAAPERKPALLAILADFGDVAALPEVLAMAYHTQPEVRRAALRTLGVLGNAEQVDFLLTRATSGPMDEQRIAREVLARLADPETDAKLLAVATGRHEEAVRVRAITTLAERRASDAAPTLLTLAFRSPPAIREESVRALRVLAPPEMMPELVDLIRTRSLAPIRDVLPQTLAQTALRIPDPIIRTDAVIRALNATSDTGVRVLLLETLGLIGGDQAFEAVRTCPDSTIPEIRRAMVSALSRFQTPEALNELQLLLLVERDEEIRPQTYSGYIAALRNTSEIALNTMIPHIRTAYEQARSLAERREFLAVAPLFPSLETLGIIEELAGDEEVAAEALRALLQTSIALVGAYPDETRQNLEQVISSKNAPEALIEEALRALAFMERFEGHIMSWAIAGPYFEPNTSADSLFSRQFPPETDADSANWRIMRLLADANPAYIIELDRVLGGDDRVAFLRTIITASEASEAILELGTNDGCRVWWNGALIHELNVGRGLVPGEDKLPVQLVAGDNTLMVAVFQHGAAWGAAARIVGQDGQPVSGLVYRPGIGEL